jgi:hypothetical protein
MPRNLFTTKTGARATLASIAAVGTAITPPAGNLITANLSPAQKAAAEPIQEIIVILLGSVAGGGAASVLKQKYEDDPSTYTPKFLPGRNATDYTGQPPMPYPGKAEGTYIPQDSDLEGEFETFEEPPTQS